MKFAEMTALVILGLINTRPGYAANRQVLRRNVISLENHVYT